MRLYDTSPIYNMIETGKVIDLDQGAATVLAILEIGNVVWKQHYLRHKITMNEAIVLTRAFIILLKSLNQLHPDPIETLKPAVKERIPFMTLLT